MALKFDLSRWLMAYATGARSIGTTGKSDRVTVCPAKGLIEAGFQIVLRMRTSVEYFPEHANICESVTQYTQYIVHFGPFIPDRKARRSPAAVLNTNEPKVIDGPICNYPNQ